MIDTATRQSLTKIMQNTLILTNKEEFKKALRMIQDSKFALNGGIQNQFEKHYYSFRIFLKYQSKEHLIIVELM